MKPLLDASTLACIAKAIICPVILGPEIASTAMAAPKTDKLIA